MGRDDVVWCGTLWYSMVQYSTIEIINSNFFAMFKILANEKRLKIEIEELHGKISESKQEIEKCKAAMADELALKRLKAANETIEMLQRKIAATKQVSYLLIKHVINFSGGSSKSRHSHQSELNVHCIC